MTIWQAFFQYANRIPQPLWQKLALVKVFDLNLMTGFGQDSDSRLRQGVTQAIGDWMGDYDRHLMLEVTYNRICHQTL